MNREDIIRMAREAGISESHAQGMQGFLEAFATLVAAAERKRLEATAWGASKKWIVEAVAAEREACAKLLEDAAFTGRIISCTSAAKAIRARGREMKPLSKLHQEAVLKAKTEQEKIKAAATAMIETPMDMIRAILLKHEQAVIEVMCELQEAKEAATKTERQRIVNLLMIQHEAAKGAHNYWHVAAKLIQADVASDT